MYDVILRHIAWRKAIGPLATLIAGGVVSLLYGNMTAAPIAVPIFLTAIVLSAFYGGLVSGLFSTAVALAFATQFLSDPGHLLQFGPANLMRFVVLAITGPLIAIAVGLLHQRETRALATEREARANVEAANRDLKTLRAALEQVDYGVVLLDAELRAIFINRAFRVIWNLPDEKADLKPAFVALMYHGRDTNAYAVPRAELDTYVAQRMALVRRGDETPLDLRLSNSEVIRFKCKTLPGGGRMLTYSSVTDLVRQAEELQALATTDPLTGIYNRRRFFALAEVEWVRFDRYASPLSLLMIDIDHFKSVNDQFGHDVGDKVILRVAAACRAAKRETDILARVGGEEFAILLPETNSEDAARFAERLRHVIAEPVIHEMSKFPSVTVSIGVAQACGGADSVPKLMKRTDDALYRAKREGRDRVVVATAADENRQVA